MTFRQTRWGFTLTELLLVLAILAMLTAIAVPVFSAALGRARETVRIANQRTARAAAVERILTRPADYALQGDENGWQCFATFSGKGELLELRLVGAQNTGELPDQWLDDNDLTFFLSDPDGP